MGILEVIYEHYVLFKNMRAFVCELISLILGAFIHVVNGLISRIKICNHSKIMLQKVLYKETAMK